MGKTRITKIKVSGSLSGYRSLKEKRSRIGPILHRLRKEFNCSALESGAGDEFSRFELTCVFLDLDADSARSHADKISERIYALFRSDEWVEIEIETIE